MYIPTDLSGAVNILAAFVNIVLEQANGDDIVVSCHGGENYIIVTGTTETNQWLGCFLVIRNCIQSYHHLSLSLRDYMCI